MQKKWVAVVALAAVFSLAMVYVASEDLTADGQDTVTYHVKLGSEERDLHIIINENYYNNIDSQYTISWNYYGQGVNDFTPLTLGTTYSNSDYSFNLKAKDGNIGEYNLTLKSLTDSQKSVVLSLKCQISVSIVDGMTGTRTYNTDPMFINVNMSLNNGNDLPTNMEYKIGQTQYKLDRVTVIEGVPVSLIPVLSGTSLNADQLNWYAFNLPKGLAMTSSGIITGVPVEHAYVPEISKIYVEDGYGNSAVFDLQIGVYEQDFNVNYYLYNGVFTETTDISTLVHEPTQFMTQRDKTVNLVVFSDVNVSVVSSTTHQRVTLSSTQVTQESTTYYCYTLPTDGTGMYKVVISGSDNVKLDTFDLYVMSKLLAVESEIIVGSDGTS